jgi:hypothetical protein
MVDDRLNKAVMRRLQELGLPTFLIDLSEFRDNFFFRRWVMFVRDGDQIADVHLVRPRPGGKSRKRR